MRKLRRWSEAGATRLHRWLDIRPDPWPHPSLRELGRGESAAIALAVEIDASRILMDDAEARAAAIRRNLSVTGTVGVLVEAHQRGLIDFESAVARLSQTSFYVSASVLQRARLLIL